MHDIANDFSLDSGRRSFGGWDASGAVGSRPVLVGTLWAMLNIGGGEILVIALVALIVVGPEQLPTVLRQAGRYANQIRSMTSGIRDEFMSGVDEMDPTKWDNDPSKKVKPKSARMTDAGPRRIAAGTGGSDDPVVPRGLSEQGEETGRAFASSSPTFETEAEAAARHAAEQERTAAESETAPIERSEDGEGGDGGDSAAADEPAPIVNSIAAANSFPTPTPDDETTSDEPVDDEATS